MRFSRLIGLVACFAWTACGQSPKGGGDGGAPGVDSGTPATDGGGTGGQDGGGGTSDGGSSDGGADPCAGVSGTCIAFLAGVSTEAQIDQGIETAGAGTTLAFGPGSFPLTLTINIFGQSGLTIQGAGIDKTILDFSGATTGSGEGILAQQGSDLVFRGFTIQDTKGNALKVENAQNVVFDSVKTAWTAHDSTANGPYGLYPVTVQNVLIENCIVIGASDSGIYVGQSQNAVVWNNEVHDNVAGIEIENTWGAEVSHNYSHGNTAGILVFDLPNLPQQGGHDVRVHDNRIIDNNNQNFAVNGDIVGQVPAGTGFLVMANHQVEVFGNTVQNSNTIGLAVASYYVTNLPIPDAGYYPFPYQVYLHDNNVTGTGTNPDPSVQMGQLLTAYQSTFPGGHVPDLLYDGALDPVWAQDAGTWMVDGGINPNAMEICFHGNTGGDGGLTFIDVNIPNLYFCQPDGGPVAGCSDGGLTNLPSIDSFDLTPFTCTQARIPLVDAGTLPLPDGGVF